MSFWLNISDDFSHFLNEIPSLERPEDHHEDLKSIKIIYNVSCKNERSPIQILTPSDTVPIRKLPTFYENYIASFARKSITLVRSASYELVFKRESRFDVPLTEHAANTVHFHIFPMHVSTRMALFWDGGAWWNDEFIWAWIRLFRGVLLFSHTFQSFHFLHRYLWHKPWKSNQCERAIGKLATDEFSK